MNDQLNVIDNEEDDALLNSKIKTIDVSEIDEDWDLDVQDFLGEIDLDWD